jgi:hypothetical protein
MARPLVFHYDGAELPFDLEKVDRSKLYGYVDVEALDPQGRRCELATLADDGRTLVGRGGTGVGMISQDGEWTERSKLKPVDPEGKPVAPVPSSYSAPVPLARKATVDEYLSHNIRGVYLLRSTADISALAQELREGTIFAFPYSFRGGLEADAGFLLADKEGRIFLAVGQPSRFRFVSLDQPAALTEETEEDETEGEDVDFSMM